MDNDWIIYFKKMKECYPAGTEHSYRTCFHNLINSIKPNQSIIITQEPKRAEGFGAPDFKIERNGAIIGYIETKNFDENLDKAIKTKQVQKYLRLSNNFIITNYYEFILIKDKIIVERSHLFYLSDLDIKSSRIKDDRLNATEELFNKFFIAEPLQIGDAKKLAEHLAERGRIVKDYIQEILKENPDNPFSQKIIGLYKVFKDTLVADLSEDEFADAYAQTVVYGFFLAFLQSTRQITVMDAGRLVPSSFKIIQEFFNAITDHTIPHHIYWIFQEIVNLINNIDLNGIYKSISFKNRQKTPDKDPYLYFYETFLGEFDPKKKKSKGVYYTPIQVVSFITRSINSLLQTEFNKNRGFADPSVTVLDFAAGTGTFLVSIFELILSQFEQDQGRIPRLIKDHLLKNFYGFEYLVAPYAVSLLKLSQLLKETGYTLQPDDRFQIYLTDTLDDSEHKPNFLMPALTREGKEANEIKTQKKILVVTGNPPYNNKSRNNKEWIRGLIQVYKPIGEKKLNLDDDYIKFIRYAHWKINETNQGIIGIISNNSFLSGLTHRKMRAELIKDFDKIYVLNLHGNSRMRETHPDGSPDQNVFDIMQSVSISIFVKKENKNRDCKIYYYDVFGKRDGKYNFLSENDITTVPWEELDIKKFDEDFNNTRWSKRFKEPFKFFIPLRANNKLKYYGEYWGISEIFKILGSGVKTDRDDLMIDFNKTDLEIKMKQACSGKYDVEFIKKYNIYNSSSYKLIDKLKEQQYEGGNIKTIHYRPFDSRFIYYKIKLTSRPAYYIFKHFIKAKNLGLCYIRNDYGARLYNYTIISNSIIDLHLLGGQTYIAPLYLYNNKESDNDILNDIDYKTANFTSDFKSFIKNRYSFNPSPEQILGYIYAVLYSNYYREKYLELLKIDFPRIPFYDEKVFVFLSSLGGELIAHHLMENIYYDDTPIKFSIGGSDTVEKIRFIEEKKCRLGKIYINDVQYFDSVPTSVWNFIIGGYQVARKWLEARISRTLSYDEQEAFIKICNILKITEIKMNEIDKILISLDKT